MLSDGHVAATHADTAVAGSFHHRTHVHRTIRTPQLLGGSF